MLQGAVAESEFSRWKVTQLMQINDQDPLLSFLCLTLGVRQERWGVERQRRQAWALSEDILLPVSHRP